MESKHRSQEKGQALILLVFGIVALLGFTALAIDGGMVYADRRHAQNAADAASLAGGAEAGKYLEGNKIFYNNWNCTSLTNQLRNRVEDAAVARAADNGITIDRDLSDGSGVQFSCRSSSSGDWQDRYLEIRTVATVDTSTAFLHFVYNGPVRNTVEAVTRIRPRSPLAFGNAIVALNKGDCSGNQNGVVFAGSSQNVIFGGGVFSNGCLRGNGSSFSLDIEDGELTGKFFDGSITSNPNVDPAPTHAGQYIPEDMVQVPVPNCSGLQSRSQGNATSLLPGNYTSLRFNNNSNVVLQRGLYCLNGTGNVLRITGGTVVGNGVTIFITHNTGSILITGGDLDLRAISFVERSNPAPAVPNVVIYSLGAANNADISITGNNESSYQGLIYCPYCTVEISGGQDTYPTFNTQVVAKNVHITGNATLDIIYTGSENYGFPSRLNLIK